MFVQVRTQLPIHVGSQERGLDGVGKGENEGEGGFKREKKNLKGGVSKLSSDMDRNYVVELFCNASIW